MLNMQNVKDIEITEGDVRTIHDKDNRLIWGRLAYDTKYAGDTKQTTYSGKNLLPSINTTRTINGVTFVTNPDGSITMNGTATADATYPINVDSVSVIRNVNLGAGTYTLNGQNVDGVLVQGYYVTDGGTGLYTLGTFTVGGSVTVFGAYVRVKNGETVENYTIYPQLEAGSTATEYEPYVGGVPSPNPEYPQDVNVVTGTQTVTISDGVDSEDYTISLGTIELCKIGDYQDYIYKSGDDWYVHKETGKSVLTGNEAGWFYTVANNRIATLKTNIGDMVSPTDANTAMAGLSDKFHADTMNKLLATADGCMAISEADYFNLKDTSWSNLATAKAGIVGTTVYYALANPTDTQITDTTLINQLDTIHQFLTRYGYNSNVTGNLPIIINQTSL